MDHALARGEKKKKKKKYRSRRHRDTGEDGERKSCELGWNE